MQIYWPSFFAGVGASWLFSIAMAFVAVRFWKPLLFLPQVPLGALPQRVRAVLFAKPWLDAICEGGRERLVLVANDQPFDRSEMFMLEGLLGITLDIEWRRARPLDSLGTVIWRRPGA